MQLPVVATEVKEKIFFTQRCKGAKVVSEQMPLRLCKLCYFACNKPAFQVVETDVEKSYFHAEMQSSKDCK